MLTRLRFTNFKRFGEAEIDLAKSVVFVGPNNSGKTTALQALALWDVGLRQWNAKRGNRAAPEKRPGVAINRRDLISIPVPVANLLWKELHVRDVRQVAGKPKTRNIRIDVEVEGISEGMGWSCGLEFDYSNEESFFCRPLRKPQYQDVQVRHAKYSQVPEQASQVKVAYLPPMSGLAATEPKLEPGRINVLMGEGQTAQVLRNLCHQVYDRADRTDWDMLVRQIESLFAVVLSPPEYVPERGEITMQYVEHGTSLDLSCSGRGLQQTLLLLAHLYANPGTVLLLDEPDAHLEILRQRQVYGLISEVAESGGSQIIAASHSEVVLNEAAGRDMVIAFVGRPHKVEGRSNQVLKSLISIGFEQYYQAEQAGWVLYLESPTDLAILQAFARLLGHEATQHLARPFVHYVSTNLPQRARDHFHGLREAKPDLTGLALFDRLDKELQSNGGLREMMWRRREIENYFLTEDVLLSYARGETPKDLFGPAEQVRREQAMREAIEELSKALETFKEADPWSPDIKATDDVLDPIFRIYFKKLDLPLTFRKGDYHRLVELLPADGVDPEVTEKLDAIVAVGQSASPRTD